VKHLSLVEGRALSALGRTMLDDGSSVGCGTLGSIMLARRRSLR